MSEPLVSIIMPYYNAEHTLPLAIASLLAQTYKNWQCIAVNDGSTDNSRSIISAASDSRFLIFDLPYNQGRGAARQLALDKANGDYLCMLDSDDWYYPDKLQSQIDVMESRRDIDVLSSFMGSLDKNGCLAGVYKKNLIDDNLIVSKEYSYSLSRFPFPYAPSIIRMDVAKKTKFSTLLYQAEDHDWLLNVLEKRKYAIMPKITYAYNEHLTTTFKKTLTAYSYTIKVHWLNRHRSLPTSLINVFLCYLKKIIYFLAFKTGVESYLVLLRSKKPLENDIQEFKKAYTEIKQYLNNT